MSNKNHNLFSVFAQQFPDDQRKTLLRTAAGRTYSYMEALDETSRMARCLSELGLKPGNRVTVQVEKTPEAVWLYLACLRGGYIFHPLNTDYQLDELVYFVSNAKPSVIVCDPEKQQLFSELVSGKSCEVLTLDRHGKGSFTAATQETAPDFATVIRKADDIAVLLYSSGTTGLPKGAMLTHGNLAANTKTLVTSWGFTAEDRLLHALPIYHAHGLFVALGCVLMSGSSMLFLSKFNIEEVIDAMPGCTVMMGVPTFYTRLLGDERFNKELCASMRLFVSGSAPFLAEHFVTFQERTGHRILERYGMTETSMNASNPLDDERRPGSVGPALPGICMRVVDDTDIELPAGEIGHLQVKGPNVFAGYWHMREKTAEEFTADGFFRTGDEAFIEKDGYISIVGRAKDMIISGGLNVFPREIEEAINVSSGVLESAVIGVPHADFGEGVLAVVVAERGQQIDEVALIESLRSRMAAYKTPKQVFVVDELPRNSMGKVQKNVLRDTYRECFS